TVYIGDAGFAKYPGQIVGCDYSNVTSISDKVEAFLFVGGGRFHALGLYLATLKPTVVADPFEKRAYSVDAEGQKVIMKRWADISKAKQATNFGVIIGLKTGQSNIETALKIKEDLEKNQRKAVLLALREITPSALLQFPTLEAFVNTACPRIALEESGFNKPVLTTKEVYVAIGKLNWEILLKKGMI
ncbi:MAG: diphthamide synthesis protein, partial [Candidatus Bathyarchaeia archaeon]